MDKFTIRSASMPTAWVIPWWLQMLPPFNKLVYVKRTYSNDYTSNTRVIVVMRKRSPETKLSDRECRDLVYAGSAMQSFCLGIKSIFSMAFWVSVGRDAKHWFEVRNEFLVTLATLWSLFAHFWPQSWPRKNAQKWLKTPIFGLKMALFRCF